MNRVAKTDGNAGTARRNVSVSVRVSQRELRAMERAAKARDLTLSEWLRAATMYWIDMETRAVERKAD